MVRACVCVFRKHSNRQIGAAKREAIRVCSVIKLDHDFEVLHDAQKSVDFFFFEKSQMANFLVRLLLRFSRRTMENELSNELVEVARRRQYICKYIFSRLFASLVLIR